MKVWKNVTMLTEVNMQILKSKKDEVYLAQGPRFEVIIGDPEAYIMLWFEDYESLFCFVEQIQSHLARAEKCHGEWIQERIDTATSD